VCLLYQEIELSCACVFIVLGDRAIMGMCVYCIKRTILCMCLLYHDIELSCVCVTINTHTQDIFPDTINRHTQDSSPDAINTHTQDSYIS
jgi:hypothetical protein